MNAAAIYAVEGILLVSITSDITDSDIIELQELLHWLRQRLPAYMIPSHFAVLHPSEVPRLTSGKVLRRGEGGGLYLATTGVGIRPAQLRLGLDRLPALET